MAAAHFFQPRRYVDATGAITRVGYDAHDLLPVEPCGLDIALSGKANQAGCADLRHRMPHHLNIIR